MTTIDIETIKTKQNELLLEVKDKYTMIERQYEAKQGLTYSHYLIKYGDKPIFVFQVPKPFGKTHPDGTTIFLKYQDSAKKLMREIFKTLSGEKDTVEGDYAIAEDLDLEIKNKELVSKIFVKDTSIEVGAISLGDPETNKKLAENFVKSFTRQPLQYKWADIKLSV